MRDHPGTREDVDCVVVEISSVDVPKWIRRHEAPEVGIVVTIAEVEQPGLRIPRPAMEADAVTRRGSALHSPVDRGAPHNLGGRLGGPDREALRQAVHEALAHQVERASGGDGELVGAVGEGRARDGVAIRRERPGAGLAVDQERIRDVTEIGFFGELDLEEAAFDANLGKAGRCGVLHDDVGRWPEKRRRRERICVLVVEEITENARGELKRDGIARGWCLEGGERETAARLATVPDGLAHGKGDRLAGGIVRERQPAVGRGGLDLGEVDLFRDLEPDGAVLDPYLLDDGRQAVDEGPALSEG